MTVPSRFNISEYCLGESELRPASKTAMIVVHDASSPPGDAEHWTYGEIDLAVRRMAAGIRAMGLPDGARIMIRKGNTSDYALLYFAIMAAGYVAVPSSAQLTEEEAVFLLHDSGASAIAVGEGLSLSDHQDAAVWDAVTIAGLKAHEPTEGFADTAAEDPAFLIYTSGTSGRPKGVLHAHRSAWGRRPMYEGWYGIRPEDRLLHAGAFNWTYTLGVGLTDPWANGATAILYNGEKDVSVWAALIKEFNASIFASVPMLYRQILQQNDSDNITLPTLRHGLTAGEALPLEVAREWRARTGTELYEALGMSECSTYISSSPSVPVREGSPGKPQTGRRIAILPQDRGETPLSAGQVGALAVHRSDPGLMLGYWNRPDEEAEVFRGDWFLGGDLAALDEDGYLWYHGRGDDVMTSMGYRVSPAEVEAALASHPDIGEVAVTEVEVKDGVRLITAFVVPSGNQFDPESILSFAAEHLAAYKRPREVLRLDTLPRTANGKVRRKDLKGLAKSLNKK